MAAGAKPCRESVRFRRKEHPIDCPHPLPRRAVKLPIDFQLAVPRKADDGGMDHGLEFRRGDVAMQHHEKSIRM